MTKTLIIAEAGVNHNGLEELAFKLVDEAQRAGADIVKFQTFKAAKLVTNEAKQADYQAVNTGKEESQFEMLSRLELSEEVFIRLSDYCKSIGIEFLTTAFDEESLQFIIEKLNVKRLKVPSGELTNAPLVLAHAKAGLPLIISSGMANLAEIEQALGVIAFGLINDPEELPTTENFQKAYSCPQGKRLLRDKVTLLHCTTEYPAPLDSINLNVIDTLASAFRLPVGYSDHSEGIIIPVAAVVKNSSVLEKHFTLDKGMEGPDHKASLNPEELGAMVEAVRGIEEALGDGIKFPTVTEVGNKTAARKSLVAAARINAGDILSSENVAIKRPGDGISPMNYWNVLGRRTNREYAAGELLDKNLL